MTEILPSVEKLVGLIGPEALLAIPPDYSGVSIAATKELIRQQRKPLRLLAVPTSGLQADLMIGAGLVCEVEAAAITLGETGLAPRFVEAVVAGRIKMKDSTCPAVHAALQAKEKGLPFIPLRGLLESDVQRHRADWKVIENPFGEKDPIVLLPALQPDVALFHAAKADRDGNVWIGRRRELVTMAHASKATLVTVEEIVEGSLLADEVTAAGVIPSLYITAIAVAPKGAQPLGLLDIYSADDRALASYAKAAKTKEGFDHWLKAFLAGEGA